MIVKRMYELGIALRAARKDAGLTQAELARRAGVSRQWISRIEQGHSENAQVAQVFAILHELGQGIQLVKKSNPSHATLERIKELKQSWTNS